VARISCGLSPFRAYFRLTDDNQVFSRLGGIGDTVYDKPMKARYRMASYWEGVKRRWKGMVDAETPPSKSGTGSSGTGSGRSGTGGPGAGGYPGKEWELVYQKFRQIEGRDPYSFQELVDWWNRA
jgi:hypothetical protein